MDKALALERYLNQGDWSIGQVVDFNPGRDHLYPFNFTASNTELSPEILADTSLFSEWIDHKLTDHQCLYGIGGYNEHRTIYARSAHFDTAKEPRRLHLGVDIWGPAGTLVYNFHEAEVHSFNYNDEFGDYGGTIILKYTVHGLDFHVLYGHLSLDSLSDLEKGQIIPDGVPFASFGATEENGFWPPHLHFQMIFNMNNLEGDYPGVCQYSKRHTYLANCPDPELILKHTFQAR